MAEIGSLDSGKRDNFAANNGRQGVAAPTPSHIKTYVLVGVVAAAVSAGTAAYVLWSRSRHLAPQVETVQDLLDRCHDQVREIERKLGELRPHAIGATEAPPASATAHNMANDAAAPTAKAR